MMGLLGAQKILMILGYLIQYQIMRQRHFGQHSPRYIDE